MVLRDRSLISLLFSLVKEYGSRINLEILILHFENKNYFDVSLKQFAFEIFQLLGYFHSWKRDYSFLCLAMRSSMKIHPEMTFCFYRFSKWRAREKARGFIWKKNLSLFEHLFLLTWIIMSSLFLMSWILWKSILCMLRALFIVLGCLLAWLERTSTST